jgi:hypothetical protein
MELAPRLRFDADVVVHGSANPLLAAEIVFSCLHGNMPEKELDLIQFSTRCMAQLRARTPKIVRRYLGKPEFPRVVFHDMPDYSFRYAITSVFACPTDTSEQSSARNSSCSPPQESMVALTPSGHRHSSDVAAFAEQIDYGPMFLALLKCVKPRSANSRRRSPQPSNTARIARSLFPLSMFRGRRLPEATGFLGREPVPKPHTQLLGTSHTPDTGG